MDSKNITVKFDWQDSFDEEPIAELFETFQKEGIEALQVKVKNTKTSSLEKSVRKALSKIANVKGPRMTIFKKVNEKYDFDNQQLEKSLKVILSDSGFDSLNESTLYHVKWEK